MIAKRYHPEILRNVYIARARAFRSDPWADYDSRARDDPVHAIKNNAFVICGSAMVGECRLAIEQSNVIAIVDDYRKNEGELFGIPVITTDEWIAKASGDKSLISLIFASSMAGYNHFMKCCAQHDLAHWGVLQYFRAVSAGKGDPVGAGQTFIYGLPFFKHAVDHSEELDARANVFDDDYSRYTYFSLLNYRLTGDPNYLTQCAIGHNNERAGYHSYVFNRSFFDLSDREVFVDGGAFDGDSIEGFVRAVKGKFRRIYSFEPSPELAEKSASRVRKLNGLFPGSVAKRVTLIRKGLWTHSTTLTFNPTLFSGNEADYVDGIPQSAHIVESGITKHLYDTDTEARLGFSIETTSIDEACEEPVSFIKLEIEGSELAALEGARRTIVSARPKMALSIYHKPEDLLTLTKYVMDTCLDYRLSLRQHNSMIPDATVCYCR